MELYLREQLIIKVNVTVAFFESNRTLLSFPNFTTMDKILNFFYERYTEISKEEFDKYVKEMSDDFNAYARSPLPSHEGSSH